MASLFSKPKQQKAVEQKAVKVEDAAVAIGNINRERRMAAGSYRETLKGSYPLTLAGGGLKDKLSA